MSSIPALQAPGVTIRTATRADHDALQALEGAAPDAGANLIQARRNFFSRMAPYDRTGSLWPSWSTGWSGCSAWR